MVRGGQARVYGEGGGRGGHKRGGGSGGGRWSVRWEGRWSVRWRQCSKRQSMHTGPCVCVVGGEHVKANDTCPCPPPTFFVVAVLCQASLPACLPACLPASLPASLPACLPACLPASAWLPLPGYLCLAACLSSCLAGPPCPYTNQFIHFVFSCMTNTQTSNMIHSC